MTEVVCYLEATTSQAVVRPLGASALGGLTSFRETRMEWKRLEPGTIARCACGMTTFFEVQPGTVTWWLRLTASLRAPAPAHKYRCRNTRCRAEYLGVSQLADEANGPPKVAA